MDTRIDVLFKVEGQHITSANDVIITSGSRNYYHSVFEFDAVWLNLSPKAVFTVGKKSYIIPLNSIDGKYECVIPWEVIDRDTGFYVGAFGGDSLRSDLTFVTVSKGAQVEGELPQPPTPDWYDNIERLTDEAVNTATEVQQRADNGEFDGKPGKDGYTPQKGIDYFTESEVAEIINKAAEAAGRTEETDPTVPEWAKASKKPTYTASEVGADPAGTAAGAVSSHNTAEDAHEDIRLLVTGLTARLNALADSDDETLDQVSELVAYIKANRELIESVTTGKVSVSDIVDNLTTNVANKPLSAAQGVALKALIDGITVPTKVSELQNDAGYIKQHQDISGKADKATTLAGYGITDGATKSDVSQLSEEKVDYTDLETEVLNQLDGAKADIVTELIAQLGGMPLFGTVNDDNTITVTSTLAEGDYVLMYENDDGTLSEIGTITIVAGVAYANLADPTSSDWLTNYRYNSSGSLVTVSGGTTPLIMTNYLDVSQVTDFHIKALDLISDYTSGNNYGRVYLYDSNKNYVGFCYTSVENNAASVFNYLETASYDETVKILHWATAKENVNNQKTNTLLSAQDISFIRFGGLCPDASQVVITANEEIV